MKWRNGTVYWGVAIIVKRVQVAPEPGWAFPVRGVFYGRAFTPFIKRCDELEIGL